MSRRRTVTALVASLALHVGLVALMVLTYRPAPAKPAPTVMRISLRPATPAPAPVKPALPPPDRAATAPRPVSKPPPRIAEARPKPPPVEPAPPVPPVEEPAAPVADRASTPTEPRPVQPPIAQAPPTPEDHHAGDPLPPAPSAPPAAGTPSGGTPPAGAPLLSAAPPDGETASSMADTALGKQATNTGRGAIAQLTPSIPGAGAFGTASGDPEGRGQTIHNDPSELPDPAAVAAVDAERVRSRIDTWVADDAATMRVQGGAFDTYFVDMKKSFQKKADHPPPLVEGNDAVTGGFIKPLLRDYQHGLARYGKTGSPYLDDNPPATEEGSGVQGGLARDAELHPGGSAENLAKFEKSGKSLRDMGDGKLGAGLLAVVEIRQASDGKLQSTVMIQPSGNPKFDTFVMTIAPSAIDSLPPPPPQGAGIHADGMRSTWAFQGKVTYKRKVKDLELLRDGWYLALTAPLLAGSFDVTDMANTDIVDLRNPQFACTVRLLQVY